MFLDLFELQVKTKSPKPDKPNKVFEFAFNFTPKRDISANDLEIRALFAVPQFERSLNRCILPVAVFGSSSGK